MLEADLIALYLTAATIGLAHTVLGPDHYLPFVAMSRVGGWTLRKTLAVTFACGVGHVLSSVVLGTLGIALGLAVGGLEALESSRGALAGWLLLGFGLAYMVWGLQRAIQGRKRGHLHVHSDGSTHYHGHDHSGEHRHRDGEAVGSGSMTPWVLFTIFVLGPCEPLIPMLMYPAAKHSIGGVVLVTVTFAACTITTMMAIVAVSCLGFSRLHLPQLERYSHALSGAAIAACGAAIHLGL